MRALDLRGRLLPLPPGPLRPHLRLPGGAPQSAERPSKSLKFWRMLYDHYSECQHMLRCCLLLLGYLAWSGCSWQAVCHWLSTRPRMHCIW